jgi:ABC-2 type transport system ATP-binding protein
VKNTSAILNIDSVRAGYGLKLVLDNISLSLNRGTSLGILGVNGAGKTTLLDLVLGLRRPRTGKVRVFGHRPHSPLALKHVGFAPEDGLPPEYLTGSEYLKFVAALKKIPRRDRTLQVEQLMDWFELPARLRLGSYSKGMRRRLVLAQAMMGPPELLILDEPLNGLDALFILKLRERLRTYLAAGGTLIFTSHILSEVERLCSEVAILHRGKLLKHSPVAQLVEAHGSVEAAFAIEVGNLE